MTTQPAGKDLDPTPLVGSLTEKSTAGKLNWQATADEHTFIASVGGETTLKITLESVEGFNDFTGNPEMTQEPVLYMLDAKGRALWEISSSQVKGGLWPMYRLAQRIGNKLDERMAAVMQALEKL